MGILIFGGLYQNWYKLFELFVTGISNFVMGYKSSLKFYLAVASSVTIL